MEKERFGRLLFGAAAVFNLVGAVVLSLMPQELAVELRMPTGAANTVYGQCFIAFIMVFAGMYWCVAQNQAKYRSFAAVGVAGKIAVVSIVACNWLLGEIGAAFPAMVLGDVVFTVGFCYYLLLGKTETTISRVAPAMRRTLFNDSV